MPAAAALEIKNAMVVTAPVGFIMYIQGNGRIVQGAKVQEIVLTATARDIGIKVMS